MTLDEYMQRKEYPKIENETFKELDNALANLYSGDISQSKAGAKRLSWNARREVGWNCYPVRLWFFKKDNRDKIVGFIKTSSSDKLIADLLHTLHWFYERYITHWTWENLLNDVGCLEYENDLKDLIEIFADSRSLDILERIAFIAAMLYDKIAWDLYQSILLKRASSIGWFRLSCVRYAEYSMTEEQSRKSIEVLSSIIMKTKNKSVKCNAENAMKICEDIRLK